MANDIYSVAFKRPFTDIKKLVIGIVLNLIPIINFFAIGYILESARSAMKKKYGLPEWTNWGQLFVQGLLAFVIVLVYSIPLLILGALFGATIVNNYWSSGSLTNIGTFGLGLGLTALVALLVAYIAPVALLNYVKYNLFGAAFRFGEVFRKAFSGEYFVAWIIMALYATILTALLNLILPWLGGAIGGFIAYLTGITLLANAYMRIK